MRNLSYIRSLVHQCDNEGFVHNCLVPLRHYLASPGGPLKVSSAQGIYTTRYVFIQFVCTFNTKSLTVKLIQRFKGGLPDKKLWKYITQTFLCRVGLKSLDQEFKYIL